MEEENAIISLFWDVVILVYFFTGTGLQLLGLAWVIRAAVEWFHG